MKVEILTKFTHVQKGMKDERSLWTNKTGASLLVTQLIAIPVTTYDPDLKCAHT